jgi:hypothetical protein
VTEQTVVPAGKNWFHNPRPANLTYWWAFGTGAISIVTDRSYSGTHSIRLDLDTNDGGGADSKEVAAMTTPLPVSITPGVTPIYIALSISGPATSLDFSAGPYFTDTTFGTWGPVRISVPTARFERFVAGPMVVPVGKTLGGLWVEVDNKAAAPQTIYIGGADGRIGETMDGFIHGSAGPRYSWEGSVNNSPSLRAEYTIGRQVSPKGQRVPRLFVYVTNRQGMIKREITDHFIDGSVNYDLDAEKHKGSCQLVLDAPGLVEPLDADEYVKLQLEIERPDGSVETGSLGMFIMDPPRESWAAGHDRWTYEGKDLLSLLDTWHGSGSMNEGSLASWWSMAAGVSYRSEIERLLSTDPYGLQLLPSQWSFPGQMDAVAATDVDWEDGSSGLEVLTDMLVGAGWQKPWVDPTTNIITSAPAGVNPANATPVMVIGTGEDSPLRWPFEVEPELGAIGNRVAVVTSKDIVCVTCKRQVPGKPGSPGAPKKGKKKGGKKR